MAEENTPIADGSLEDAPIIDGNLEDTPIIDDSSEDTPVTDDSLEDLHRPTVQQIAERGRHAQEIPLGEIEVAANMRSGELPDIKGLAISIREVGLITPLLVRAMEEESYRLVAGRRRLAALHLIDDTPLSTV